MAAPAGRAATEDGTCEDLDACLHEIHELEADINLLNLINGLHLTEEQIRVILKAAGRLEKDLQGVGAACGADHLEEEAEMLTALRDHLKKGRKIPNALRTRYEEFKKKEQSGRNAWRMKPKVLQKIQAGAAQVHDALLPAQREVLTTYKPCLVPPKDLKDPVRVGQAGAKNHMEGFLSRIRQIPEYVYANRLDEILEGVIAQTERHVGAFQAAERAHFLRTLKKACHRARDMSPAQFQLEKADLSAELEKEDKALAMVEELADLGVAKYHLEGRIVQFLLTPRIVPLLKKRLHQIETSKEARNGAR
jgi:hypothetical protein